MISSWVPEKIALIRVLVSQGRSVGVLDVTACLPTTIVAFRRSPGPCPRSSPTVQFRRFVCTICSVLGRAAHSRVVWKVLLITRGQQMCPAGQQFLATWWCARQLGAVLAVINCSFSELRECGRSVNSLGFIPCIVVIGLLFYDAILI